MCPLAVAQEFKEIFDKCKESLNGLLDPPGKQRLCIAGMILSVPLFQLLLLILFVAKFSGKNALEILKETDNKSDSTTPESESKAAENRLTDRLSKLELKSTMEKQSINVAAR